jgi:hypothetical protein
MRLCTLRIGIHFLKDPGFRAPIDNVLVQSFHVIYMEKLER